MTQREKSAGTRIGWIAIIRWIFAVAPAPHLR
jgi:hypothetical protein